MYSGRNDRQCCVITWRCILCDLSQGVLGYEIIISLWYICIAICLVRVVCERLTIMARKLIETLFTYCFVTYYGLMMFFVVLWQMIRRLTIPPRAKRRETRKWVGPMFVGHVVNFSCVYFTPYKHSSYALQWVDSSKESVLMPLLPSLFSLTIASISRKIPEMLFKWKESYVTFKFAWGGEEEKAFQQLFFQKSFSGYVLFYSRVVSVDSRVCLWRSKAPS